MGKHRRNIQQQIADMISGALSFEEKEVLQKHLYECSTCRAYLQKLQADEELLEGFSDSVNSTVTRIEQNIIASLDNHPSKQQHETICLWRTLIKSNAIKFAAAALIVVLAAFFIIKTINVTSPVFADMLEQVRKAKTVTFKMTHWVEGKQNGFPVTVMSTESGWCRYESDVPGYVVADNQGRTLLGVHHTFKSATLTTHLNGTEPIMNSNFNLLEEIKGYHKKAGKFLRREKLNGQTTDVFLLESDSRQRTIWVDPETNLPVLIKVVDFHSPDDLFGAEPIVTMSDFVWNPDLDESLFSMEIPEGYTLVEMQIDLSSTTEQDLEKGFRVWVELNDKTFPRKFNGDALRKLYEDFKEGLDEKEKPGDLKLQAQFNQNKYQPMNRALKFTQRMTDNGQWRYVGKDVQFGDTDTPICWWRPEGSETYRIMYGDLNIRDVEPADMSEIQDTPQ